MFDFRESMKNLKKKVTKKEVIIATMALATLVAGTTTIIVACGDKEDEVAVSESSQVEAKEYTLTIETAKGVSARALYEKLCATTPVAAANFVGVQDGDLNIEYADESSTKDFSKAGDYKETLVIFNKADNSVTELTLSIKVKAAVTTAPVTTTAPQTTTTVATTTTKVKTTEKKKEEKKEETKTETKQESSSSDEGYYEEEYYEEPAYEEDAEPAYEYVETPKEETPAPEPEPEPVDDSNPYGFTGYDLEMYNYAISQGCTPDLAQCYVTYVGRVGRENVFIGEPPVEGGWWGVWIYDPADGSWNC